MECKFFIFLLFKEKGDKMDYLLKEKDINDLGNIIDELNEKIVELTEKACELKINILKDEIKEHRKNNDISELIKEKNLIDRISRAQERMDALEYFLK